jgi:hypothetical protein
MNKVFTSRELGKKASELSREDFIKMMIEDINVVKVEYRKWSDEQADRKYAEASKRYTEDRERKINNIIETSFKKYKKEYYRLRWVENEISKLPETLKRDAWFLGKDLEYLCWGIKPWSIDGSRTIHTDSRIERELDWVYSDSINNNYFRECTGWTIITDSYSTKFKLHLSDELQAEWKADEHNLAEGISRFYAGSNWWGD